MANIAVLTCIIIGLLMAPNAEGAPEGRLVVTAIMAQGLMGKEDVWDQTNPYMEVIALTYYGYATAKATHFVSNSLNPKWDEELDFGYGHWAKIIVGVYDHDYNSASDAQLSDLKLIYLPGVGYYQQKSIPCYGNGVANIEVSFK